MNHVVFAGDDGVARCMAVAMRSVWENVAQAELLQFHVIHAMSQPSIYRIQKSLPDAVNIHFVDGRTLIGSLPRNNGRVVDTSQGYWLRSFAADLLPEVDKAIYLDADTLCLSDIGKLFKVDLQGMPIGAVIDAYKTFEGAKLEAKWGTDNAYFNSGVLLCDFEAWREEKLSTQIVELVSNAQPSFAHLDQDALNIIFKDRWLNVCQTSEGEEWNDRRTSRLARQNNDDAVVDAQLRTANVLHFTTPYKPWRKEYPDTSLPFTLWHSYAGRTDFAIDALEDFDAIGWHNGRWEPTPEDDVLLAQRREATSL